jgi:urate oxidase
MTYHKPGDDIPTPKPHLFDVENKNEVFHADDRPYGYIEGTVRRDDAPNPGPDAFDPGQGW